MQFISGHAIHFLQLKEMVLAQGGECMEKVECHKGCHFLGYKPGNLVNIDLILSNFTHSGKMRYQYAKNLDSHVFT